jgi:hypothetical protein
MIAEDNAKKTITETKTLLGGKINEVQLQIGAWKTEFTTNNKEMKEIKAEVKTIKSFYESTVKTVH